MSTSTVTPERSDVSTNVINVGLLPAYITPLVAARLGVPAPGHVTEGRTRRVPDCLTENHTGTCECADHDRYSDGYGGTYAVGE